MTTEATAVMEAAEAVAPVVTQVTLDPKKVALAAGGVIVICVAAWGTKKLIDKRRAAKKVVIVQNAVEVQINPEEQAEKEEK